MCTVNTCVKLHRFYALQLPTSFSTGDVQLPVLTTPNPWQLIHQTALSALFASKRNFTATDYTMFRSLSDQQGGYWGSLDVTRATISHWSAQCPCSVCLSHTTAGNMVCHSTACPFRQHWEGVFHRAQAFTRDTDGHTQTHKKDMHTGLD